MGIQNIPTEVLSGVIGFLSWSSDANRWGPAVELADLRSARLVCRQWNALASAHMFREVALLHTTDGKDFDNFKKLTASPTVQQAARCAGIYSGPHHFGHDMTKDNGRSYEDWDQWKDGDYEEFTDAIDCIANLPKLHTVHIRFGEGCSGVPDSDYGFESGVEEFSTRLNALQAVFSAIAERKARGSNTAITTLAIENLQNKPIPDLISTITALAIENLRNRAMPDVIPTPDFISADFFGSVVKDITNLRLLIAHEYNEAGPDHDLDCVERRTFEPWLQTELLPLFANQLTSLHLSFQENWGVAPGYFDGKDLVFPHLKNLTLGEFVIGHHDQFDWVLAQKNLETLRLDRCVIVSHLAFFVGHSRDPHNALRDWDVRTHDWREYPTWSFGMHDGKKSFTFSGTWETVFDAIRSRLTNLVDFRMGHVSYRGDNHFNTIEHMRCTLPNARYIVLDTGLLPSPWITADEHTGNMDFGNNNPAVLEPENRTSRGSRQGRMELNRAKETLEGDTRALMKLVRAVEDRRRQKGLPQIST